MPPKKKNKVKELEESLKEAESKADNYLNQLKYVKADLENLEKQNQRQVSQIIDRANGRILLQLLPIVDELWLIHNNSIGHPKTQQGIEMIYKKLMKLMESEGCQPIEAIGIPFDPFKHEAVFEVETEEQPEGCVLEEIRKGYIYKDRVLRASMVKVARTPVIEENENE
jgi:molecular chaperone GrpE